MSKTYVQLFLLFLFSFISTDHFAQTQVDGKWLDTTILNTFEYRCVGPTRGGRVTAVAGVEQNTATYYMGATGGGVWKTEDHGIHWKNVSDGYFATPSIGAITVDQKNPNTIYVGTGSDGLRSNVITGKGIYKSTNGGKTWTASGLENTGQIGAVEIHPTNSNIIFVAAIGQAFNANQERGLYRSKDGGENWEKVLYINDKIGIVDMEFAPNNPEIIYAAAWKAERKPWTIISGGYKEGGIYKSIDGGDNWTKLEQDLPQGLIGKIDLTVSAAAPNRLYALVEAPEEDNQEGRGGLYRSDDFGATFSLVSTKRQLLDRPFYYCNIKADPQNANTLYASATRFFKSTDAGKTWVQMSTPHGDNHDIWINPNDSMNFIQGNDGGANVTLNGGKSWSSQFNQATAELYQIEVDDQVPYWIYAGQQDNYTTIALPSLPPYTIQAGLEHLILNVGGCETGPAVPKPGNPDIVYANCKGRFGVYNKKTGQEKRYYVGASNMYGHNPKDLKYRFQRVSPIHVSPHNPDVVYHTSQFVHKTLDEGKSWETISPDLTAFEADKQMISGSPITRDITGEEFYSTIYAIQESKLEAGLIWVGANDGPVHVTRDGGKDGWKNVSPSSLPKGARIDCVEPSTHQKGKAYFTALRYQLGDWKPYIYKTENYGASWTLLTDGNNGIPADYPVRVVREDPDRAGLLYAGTEFGLFISLDDGKNWHAFQNNLPVSPITDLKVHQKDLVISTMGRSFWILDDLSVLHESLEQLAQSAVQLYQPRDAHRLRYRSTSKKSIPYYPVNAVNINYYLKEDAKNGISLDILDRDGKLIKSFKSKGAIKASINKERNMSTEFSGQGSTPSLKSTAGLHQFHWDMRHEGVWDANIQKSGRSGPLVAPGEYTVRLKANGKTLHETFKIKIDPKVEQNGVSKNDLLAQEALNLKIRDLRSKAKRTLHKIQEDKKELKRKEGKQLTNKEKQKVEALVQLANQFITKKGRYHQPMLIDQLRYLNSMIRIADQHPGMDAYLRYNELEEQLKELSKEYLKITKK
jgi:photosystem II stability/assembly factor-like uncharacterized protein